MASQARYTPWPGTVPDQGEPLPELLASFEHGGARAEAAPSAPAPNSTHSTTS
jgi:hypothetical protein